MHGRNVGMWVMATKKKSRKKAGSAEGVVKDMLRGHDFGWQAGKRNERSRFFPAGPGLVAVVVVLVVVPGLCCALNQHLANIRMRRTHLR
jgi:hypothetical protein